MAAVQIIGLTGGIASGKSTVAGMLAEHGAVVVDADVLGHEVYEPGTDTWQAVRAAFGDEIVQPDGRIDRRKLGALVFADSEAMKRLTGIVWPAMKAELRRRLSEYREAGVDLVVVEAAILLEAGWDDQVDEVWAVTVEPAAALQRLTARNGMTDEDARRRLAAQLSNAERAARAAHLIENNGTISDLARQVEALWQSATGRAA
jgi:dephospho-CoA kinase